MRPDKSSDLSQHFSPIHLIYRYPWMIPTHCPAPVPGRTVAITDYMILLILRMKVLAEKRKELSQTINSLLISIRKEKGCRRCDFCGGMEDENEFHILEEWDTRESLNDHLKSERFRVLRGAMNLLQEPYEMMVYKVAGGNRKTEAFFQPAA